MTTISRSAHPRESQPRSLIVTIYGLYARDVDGWLSIATLIRLLADLDVDDSAVRSSVSRLKRRGVLEPERAGGAAGYALSPSARAILGEGDQRIFGRRRAAPDEGWLLAVFSVPEAERQRRHLLRSRLSWLGFGTVSAGVWVAPAHVESETRSVLAREGLSPYVDLFRADHVDLGGGEADGRRKVGSWWDLAALGDLYEEFLRDHRPTLATWKRRRRPDDSTAFTDHTRAVTAWRRLPFLDPGLAADLLPPQWPGASAADLFFALHAKLAEPALRHVEATRRGQPSPESRRAPRRPTTE